MAGAYPEGFARGTAAGELIVRSPIDGAEMARLQPHSQADVTRMIEQADAAFRAWRSVPAPRRGEFVRLFGEALRAEKVALAQLVSSECGKILAEGLGEVQEMIDIC
ncbi:MAG: aldehyde dehydrogenase family protein, partial [Pseudomonadales bacterium]|nr:aldehyde dehydrogenase family protein [Pseudomonadales bacterium]